ncbi:MAG: transposase [Schwartzia succinivorans]|nr:transposase [Schwartzia succinivorans]
MHVNGHRSTDLRHLAIGPALTCLRFDRKQFYCPHCHMSRIIDIMDMCEATGNRRLGWFKNMLDKHFEGIIAHATYRKLSAGKIEGINNKIKTTRRQGYGYPDDEYFFLKLFDI